MFGVTLWEILTKGEKPYGETKMTTETSYDPAVYATTKTPLHHTMIGIAKGHTKLQVPSSATTSQSKMVKVCLSYEPEKRPSLDKLAAILGLVLPPMKQKGQQRGQPQQQQQQ
uniref:Serine-threonine/tyrosine-protein kinase catalytic domain-containing protein n=1 Tax=Lotharella oceanica TaxID=641309 RepID=A0A7S2XH40_9EUKA|mmetsp:Transcript_7282/g.14282  ORF Transcript_7282/g.14282 Transcript_7282/m.14282 type:complete len:113 (+) Transcript_7282:142-480(+)